MCADNTRESWPQVPDSPVLRRGEIHLYRCRLSRVPAESFVATLSAQEQERAERFQRDQLRHRFVASHVFLRHILAACTGTAPERLQFSHNDYGKPYLSGETSLWFNLAHSADIALVAVTRTGEIGVDVEHLREVPRAADIADRYFHTAEKALLQTTDPDLPIPFLSIWTRKEACIKAVGRGLAQSLATFDVSGENPIMLPERNSHSGRKKLMLTDLHPARGYVGAVAVAGRASALSRFTFQP